MSNFTDFISSSGGGGGLYGGVILEIPILDSQTWVPPRDGTVNIIAIGGGGSGYLSTPNTGGIALGGGAGGYCAKEGLSVTTSGSYTITIGAGGTGVYSTGSAGVAGGSTTVSGTGLAATITANGGAGGTGTANYSANSSYGFGPSGGTASGGDVNRTGGRGGGFSPTYVTNSNSTKCATGGGAVAILTDVGFQGGSFVKTGSNYGGALYYATGGAGIGGRGGGLWNINGTSDGQGNSFQGSGSLNGGSAAGPGWDLTQDGRYVRPSGINHQGLAQLSAKYQDLSLIGATRAAGGASGYNSGARNGGNVSTPYFNRTNSYTTAMPSSTVGAGGGGCFTNGTPTDLNIAGYGGAFAGGGAMVSLGAGAQVGMGGGGGIGGGGGGLVGAAFYSRQQQTGGQGVVFIHYTAFA